MIAWKQLDGSAICRHADQIIDKTLRAFDVRNFVLTNRCYLFILKAGNDKNLWLSEHSMSLF